MYFDPGTGSLIIQLIVAGIASIGAFFALFRNRINGLFHKDPKETKEKPKRKVKKDEK